MIALLRRVLMNAISLHCVLCRRFRLRIIRASGEGLHEEDCFANRSTLIKLVDHHQ